VLLSGAAGAAGAATLSSLAFVALSEKEQSNGGKTHEEAMLEASRAELEQQVPRAIQHSKKVRRGIYFFIDLYIFEPIATGLRFLHLVIIFVPVLLTVPMIWVGGRIQDRDNEKWGTLWWYGFLVRSMERAGAAFIKVWLDINKPFTENQTEIVCIAGPMGCFKIRHLPYRTLLHHVYIAFECACTLYS